MPLARKTYSSHLFKKSHHYRTRLLCRVPQTLGKGRKTLGNNFAECSSRRSAHGVSSIGEAGFAECRFSGTRQSFVVCQVALDKKSVNGTGERDGGRGLCRVPSRKHSAKIQSLPSAKGWALSEVLDFAACCQLGTRRSLELCRVPHVWHSVKLQTLPSVYVIALGKAFFQKIGKWSLCRVSG